VSEIKYPVHCSSGEKLQSKTIRAVSASLSPALQRMPRRERPGRRLFSRWRRRRHVTAFPGKPPTRVERIFTGDSAYVASNGDCRSMYYSSEPRIEITEPAAIGEQLPHGRQKPVG
jgi:hypothetical protein